MALKWTRKDCIEHITQLKSPFEDMKAKENLPERLKNISRNRREENPRT